MFTKHFHAPAPKAMRFSRVGSAVSLLLALLFVSQPSQVAALDFEGSAGYHTRYMLEGIDLLDNAFESGDGGIVDLILSFSHETEIATPFMEIILIGAASEDYREAEVILGAGKSMGDFSASLSFSRFFIEADYGSGDETDYYNEYTVALAYEGLEHVTPAMEFVYSDLNYGELLVLSLEGEVKVGEMTFTPYVLADFDFEYVSEDYDGLNHVQVGVSWPVPFPGERELTAYVNYSMAGENLRREDETDHDFLWAGVTLAL